jgi:diguanylate cyclase (GGDEF)-like protein
MRQRSSYPKPFKAQVVQECLLPGATVSSVAITHGINANVIRKWLPLYRNQSVAALPAFVPLKASPSALQELQHTNQELGHLAATDPLTGADNRRRFMERVEVEIDRTKRDGASFSVLALDLDNFKSINDRFGHQVGDDILKSFVEICLDSIRPYDGVARVGGEEFMILLPQTSLESAHVIAERLRSTVASNSFHGLQRSTGVTVSIGVSQSGRDEFCV